MKKEVKLAKIVTFFISLVAVVSVTFFVTNLVFAASWQAPNEDPPEGNPPGFIYGYDEVDEGPQDVNMNISGKAKSNIIEVNNAVVNQDIIVKEDICFDDNSDDNCIDSWDDIDGGGESLWEINTGQGFLYPINAPDINRTARIFNSGVIQSFNNSDWIELLVEPYSANKTNAIIRWGDDKGDPNGPDRLRFQFYDINADTVNDVMGLDYNSLGTGLTLFRTDGLWNYFNLPTPVYNAGAGSNRNNSVWQFGLFSGNTSAASDHFYIGRSGISMGDLAVFRDGNVGIGIGNISDNRVPSDKLEVAGNIRVNNAINFPRNTAEGIPGVNSIQTVNNNKDLAIFAQQNLYLISNEQPYDTQADIGDVIITKDSSTHPPFLTAKSSTGNIILNSSNDSGNGKLQIYGPGSGGSEISIIDTAPQIKFVDTDGDDYWIHNNSGRLYFLWDELDDGDWDPPYPLYFSGRDAWFGEKVVLRGADSAASISGNSNYLTKGISWDGQSDNSFKYNGTYLFQYGMGFHTPPTPFNRGEPGRGSYMSGHYGIDFFVGVPGGSTNAKPTLSIDQRGNDSHVVAINPQVSSINQNALARAALDIHHDLCLLAGGIGECGLTVDQLKLQAVPIPMIAARPFRSSGVPQVLLDDGPDGVIRMELLGDEASGLIVFTNPNSRFSEINGQLSLWVVDSTNPGGTAAFSVLTNRTNDWYGKVFLGGIKVLDQYKDDSRVTISPPVDDVIVNETEEPLLVLDSRNGGDQGSGSSLQFRNNGAGYLAAIAGLDYGSNDVYPNPQRQIEFRAGTTAGSPDTVPLDKNDTVMTLDNWGNLKLRDKYSGAGGGQFMTCDASGNNCTAVGGSGGNNIWTDAGTYIYNPNNTVRIYDDGSIFHDGKFGAITASNDGRVRGFYVWQTGNTNHVIYSSHSVSGISPAGANAPDGLWDTGHRLRLRTYATGQGFLFENSAEQSLVDIDSDNGNIWTIGNIRSNGSVQASSYCDQNGSNCKTITQLGGSTADNDWTVLGNNIYSSVSGNVGIGTTLPTAKLDVVGLGGSTVDLKVSGRIMSNSSSGGMWLSNSNDGFVGNNGTNIGFWTNGVAWNAFQINKSTGNVGIGTAAPASKLDVAGVTTLGSGGNSDYVMIRRQNSTAEGGELRLQDYNASGNWTIDNYQNNLRLISSGNRTVQIGGVPAFGIYNNLDVGAGDLYVNDQAGTVGIGTNAPTEKLDVNGNVRVRGTLDLDIVPKTCDSGTIRTTCECPTGYIILSGGGQCYDSLTPRMYENYPNSDNTKWTTACWLGEKAWVQIYCVRIN